MIFYISSIWKISFWLTFPNTLDKKRLLEYNTFVNKVFPFCLQIMNILYGGNGK